MSKDSNPTIGDQELALLRWIADRHDASVGEAAQGFGNPRAIARTTVLTMMERLRAKGLLERERVAALYRYRPASATGEVLQGVVSSFVERTLGGSAGPLVAYLTRAAEVTDEELAELEALVESLQARRAGEEGR